MLLKNHKTWFNRGLLALTAIIPVILVALFGKTPVQLIITAQALNGLLLPLITVTIFILSNKRKQMGDFRNSTLNNVILSLIIIIVIFLTVQVLVGLF